LRIKNQATVQEMDFRGDSDPFPTIGNSPEDEAR
jgi:hypothetical protein